MQSATIAIIGGGAAGFFAALSAKKHFPNKRVIIFEKSAKVLSKVKISGGGRCNVTNACFDNRKLAAFYPRGENNLRKAFEIFNAQSTVDWFESRNVPLKTFPDNCIFPQSNDSQSIIDCLLKESLALGVEIKFNQSITSIEVEPESFKLFTREDNFSVEQVIVTTGGQPKRSGLEWLEKLGHEIIEPVPSLFTFNMPANPIRDLMGNVVEKASVKVEGTKLIGKGPLLVTHWGMSGPAILQLSAWGARLLFEKNYQFAVLVNWLDDQKEVDLHMQLDQIIREHGEKMIGNLNPFPMTSRLWNFLLEKTTIHPEMRWKDLGNKTRNKLVNTLLSDRYEVSGKTTFKEEFVTAGGISLNDVNFKTMESKIIPGMFFAGELLDIDGITGGFNFQAAWTTGFIAGKSVGLSN
jgi:predicted Rossmann fold flavoprotein